MLLKVVFAKISRLDVFSSHDLYTARHMAGINARLAYIYESQMSVIAQAICATKSVDSKSTNRIDIYAKNAVFCGIF